MKTLNILRDILILFLISKLLSDIHKGGKHYSRLAKEFKKRSIYNLNNLSYMKKLSNIIKETELNIGIKNINIISSLSIFCISVILFIITFIYSYKLLNLIISSIILSIFVFFIPLYILKYISYSRKIKILNIFPNYIISLKNYTDVNNDIIFAFKKAEVEEPLSKHINKFNISIEKGIKVYDAFETLKTNINIKRINEFITLLQFCHIYGGNFTNLLDRFSKIQMKTNLQREKEKQKIFSSKLVLLLLILINIYILFGFVLANNEYYNVLIKTFVGNIILNTNILSYIFIFYMYVKLNKMED